MTIVVRVITDIKEVVMYVNENARIHIFNANFRLWGGELPEISQKTMQAAIEMIDKAMHELGFSVLDQEV